MASGRGSLLFVITGIACIEGFHHHSFNHKAKTMNGSMRSCDRDEVYRRMDGRCNNLANPEWGAAGSILPRFLPNAYANGVNSPRDSGMSGKALPSPRLVSLNTHGPSDAVSKVTLMAMPWGQFLSHDITLTPFQFATDCCNNGESECNNIQIPTNDDYFKGLSCMPLQRSLRTLVGDVEEQYNVVTAFIDASHVYGNSPEETQGLRGRYGLLKTVRPTNGRDLLPVGPDTCRNVTGEYCYAAGDQRVNIQPSLTAMHTIFMREHNRIARELRRKFHWGPDRIFEEARKIMGAMMQHITYNEYLPLVLGPEIMEKYGLDTAQPFTYGQEVNPGIRNEFSTAAFRFGHSMIPEEITVDNENLRYENLYFRPTTILHSMAGLVSALSQGRSPAANRQFAYSITRHLFQFKERNGTDLVARNIQRGRDHGLQPLNEYRKFCSVDPYRDLAEVYPGDATAQGTYEHVDDVDLFSGGMAEERVEGGLVGPTFACLLGRQLKSLRDGDRFFYLNREGNQRFTQDQLDEIKKIRLSKLICEDTEQQKIQENVFLPESERNPARDCTSLVGINLGVWGDEDSGGDHEPLRN